MKTAASIALIMAAIAGGCTDRPEAVPRAVAYPRAALPDTAAVPYSIGAVSGRLSAAATVDAPRRGWLTAGYPTVGAQLHISVTDTTAAALEQVKANRMQRLLLNAGDCPTTNREFTTVAGFTSLVATTAHSATPVQFLATDGRHIVVSGAVFMPAAADAAPDSVAPIIEYFEHEATRLLLTLRHE